MHEAFYAKYREYQASFRDGGPGDEGSFTC